MSLELIAVLVGVVAAGLTAVQVWQGLRRRRAGPASADATRALREEAAVALTDAGMNARTLGWMGPDDTESELMRETEERLHALIRLQSRLRISSGISEHELDAFTAAIHSFFELSRTVSETRRDYLSTDKGGLTMPAESEAVIDAYNAFLEASQRFEVAAREAARR